MSAADFASFSNSAVTFAGVVYALAFLAHLTEWAMGRTVPVDDHERVPVAVGAEVSAGSATDVAPESHVEETSLRMETAGRIGVGLTVLAGALHLAGLVARGLASEPARVPWSNMYEFTLAGSAGVTLIYLALLRKYHLRWLGPVLTGLSVVILMLAGLVLYEPVGPLIPALQSYWLVVHVVAAIIATGAFTIGGMTSLLFLVKIRAEERGGGRSASGYIARLPRSEVLDRVAYRVHAFGFPIWTFAALVAGPIWAEYAWGRYWGWDPKEIWAFITWVAYAAYLHARATAGWKGKTAAVIALIALATLLFNFVGINYFFGGTSQHSYA